MGILDSILGAQGGGAANELAGQFGLDQSQMKNALGALVPALNSGIKKNTASQGGLDALLGAINKGDHQKFLEQPALLKEDATRDEGNKILGHIFGSKDTSRQVAQAASQKTGIDEGTLKKLLPVAATMVMGSLGQNKQQFAGGGGGSNPLAGFLDSDGDGSVADDLLGMAGKFFGR